MQISLIKDRIVVPGQPATGVVLDCDDKGHVIYGVKHDGTQALVRLSPDEAVQHGVQLIQLAVIARSTAAQPDPKVGPSPIVT